MTTPKSVEERIQQESSRWANEEFDAALGMEHPPGPVDKLFYAHSVGSRFGYTLGKEEADANLVDLLRHVRAKLEVYFRQTGGVYSAGVPYQFLIPRIDEALRKYEERNE